MQVLTDTPGRSRTILLITGSTTIGRIIEIVLRRESIRVIIAENIAETYSLLPTETAAIILLDTTIGDEAIEICRTLRHIPSLKEIPIILFLSRYGLLKNALLRGIGIADILIKPFTPADLIEIVREYLQ